MAIIGRLSLSQKREKSEPFSRPVRLLVGLLSTAALFALLIACASPGSGPGQPLADKTSGPAAGTTPETPAPAPTSTSPTPEPSAMDPSLTPTIPPISTPSTTPTTAASATFATATPAPVSPAPSPTTSAQSVEPVTDAAIPVVLVPALALASAEVARDQGLAANEVKLVSFRAVNWPNPALGCPKMGVMYTQVITPGYILVLRVGGKEVEYHTDTTGRAVTCANPGPPAAGGGVNPQ